MFCRARAQAHPRLRNCSSSPQVALPNTGARERRIMQYFVGPSAARASRAAQAKTWNCVMLFYYVCGMYGTSRMETARPPSPYKEGPVFIAALKDGPVFIRASFHSAFTVKCKRAHVFSYYPPQGVSLSGSLCTVDTVCVCRLSCHAVCPWRNADGPRASDPRSRLQL